MILKNGLELTIEKASVGDASQVVEYLNIVGGESDNLTFGADEFNMTVEAEEKFIDNLSSSNVSALLVGKIDGEVVCVGSISSPMRKRMSHQAELALSVKKKYWGIGVGSYLMEKIISFAGKMGKRRYYI